MIRVLDDATIGQIAAGEVIERPVSIVKELVENALDAGARSIAVVVARGGVASIEVRDDGTGITRGDLRLCARRHATSKLRDAAELGRVATLGFRGEGLASIAAIAHLRITSRVADEDVGYAVEAHGETVSDAEPVAAPPGTRVVAGDLFANMPVRREYLRSAAAEFSRISAFLATVALGYPHVRFALAHDGREVWAFPAATTLEGRLAHVFGAGAARDLLALEAPPLVHGFVSRPGRDRPDRRMQYLFVNGRLLRSSILAGAWSGGYSTFAMSGRYPYGVLFLRIAPERVDPNVHPTKSDVRLRDGAAVAERVRAAIRETLRRHAATQALHSVSFAPPAREVVSYDAPSPSGARETRGFAFDGESGAAARLRVLAQLDHTFILATDGEALVLVDQHAAHERIAYESIARRAVEGGPSEPLLVPYTVEVEAEAQARFEVARPALAEAGLEVELFGERTYRVVATPAGYGARRFDVRPFLADLADEVAGRSARERTWASLACHSVVRAGEPLEHAEMAALLSRLVACENPMHCPHGRPTIVRVEPDSIARMFKRT